MPEGVSGIEDLKVMIAADSEKLGQGITQAKDIVAKFAESTGVELGRFEKFLESAGSKVDGLEKRLVGFLGKAQSAWSSFDRLVGEGGQYAAMAGLEDSYQGLVSAWSDFKSMADTSVAPAFELISSKAVAFATELSETHFSPATKKAAADAGDLSEALAGSSDKSLVASMGRAQERGRSLSKTLLDEFAAALRLATAHIDSATREAAERQEKSLTEMVEHFKRTIAEYERAIAEAEAKSSQRASVLFGFDGKGGSMLTMGIDDARRQMEKARAELAELNKEVERRKETAAEQGTTEGWGVSYPEQDAQIQKITESLKQQVVQLERQAQAIGMTVRQRAEFDAFNKAVDQFTSQGLKPRDEDLSRLRELASLVGRQAEETKRLLDVEKQRGGLKQITDQMERELETIKKHIVVTREASGAAEEMAAREKALTLAQQRNIELTPEMISSIEAYAQRIGAAARELDAMKKQLEMFRETGQLVARSLESAFRQWTESGKVDVREMVRSMLADLAMLTFRKNVADVLGGGITSGLQSLLGGGGSAIAGAGGWSTSVQPAGFLDGLFSGFRADGGPVEAGRMYMVGERGPEPFIPKVDGTILPAGSKLGGPQITIATTIHAPGATAEAAAMIERRLAEHEARMPGVILEVTREARERGLG